MIKYIPFLLMFSFTLSLDAQEWIRLMENSNTNFYDVQKAFDEHFEGQAYEKGRGWKQYKRWEYFMEPRVYPSGDRIDPTLAWKESMKFRKAYHKLHPQAKSTSNWQPLGPDSWTSVSYNPGNGRVNVVEVHPKDSNTIFIGAPSGGLWKSADAGTTWTPLTDDMPVLGVSGIAIHPENPDTMYIATGDGDGGDTYSIGVLKTTDGGQTWNTTGLNFNLSSTVRPYRLLMNPDHPDTLLVATSLGVYVTEDAGTLWRRAISGTIRDMEFKPGNPDIVYISGTRFFTSINGGMNFVATGTGLPSFSSINRMAIAVSNADTNVVYALCGKASDATFEGLYRSADGGATFSLQSSSPNLFGYAQDGSDNRGQSWYDMALAVSHTNVNELYVGGINVWKSLNGGLNWTISSHWVYPSSIGYTHADIHSLDFFNGVLYCGSDGGIFTSANNGNTWTDLSADLEITQFYRMGGTEMDSTRIIAGAQDNGCNIRSGTNWLHILGADGMECAIDPNNTNTVYYEWQGGGLHRSDNSGLNRTYIAGTMLNAESGAWVTPFVIDPNNSSTLYAAYQNVWKSTNRGNTWSQISFFGSSSTLRSIAVAPSNSNVIYTCTNSNLIRRTTNGGLNWTVVNSGIPNRAITYIAVHPTDPNTVWVSLSGSTSNAKVYETTDGGQSWINRSSNLPNLPVNTIAYDTTTQGLYVGTDVGVYYTNPNMNNWIPFMDNLPNVIVNELEIHYTTGKIRAATYGRGVWESPLYEPLQEPTADFSANASIICPNGTIQFNSLSKDSILSTQWIFQGGTPDTAYVDQPMVTYANVGSYDVTLIVTNRLGADTLVSTAFVDVQLPSGDPVPVSEDFEGSFPATGNKWSTENPDALNEWSQIDLGFSKAIEMDNFQGNPVGAVDHLLSPDIDFNLLVKPELSFDLAYASDLSRGYDTLAIYYSTDCGNTLQKIWEQSGNQFITAGSTTNRFVPTAMQWQSMNFALDSLIGKGALRFVFENRSAGANVLYLDNILIRESSVSLEENNASGELSFYPNPTKDQMTISRSNTDEAAVATLINAMGKTVRTLNFNAGENQQVLSLEGLATGVYFIRWQENEKISLHKILKH